MKKLISILFMLFISSFLFAESMNIFIKDAATGETITTSSTTPCRYRISEEYYVLSLPEVSNVWVCRSSDSIAIIMMKDSHNNGMYCNAIAYIISRYLNMSKGRNLQEKVETLLKNMRFESDDNNIIYFDTEPNTGFSTLYDRMKMWKVLD